MTDSEYLSQRKELENRIAQLDAAHLNDREYMDGDHVHIDIGWKSVRGAAATSKRLTEVYTTTITR